MMEQDDQALLDAINGRNVAGVRADLAAWAECGELRPKSAGLASIAITLALTLDLGAELATAAVAKELRAVLGELRVQPERTDDDGLGDLGTAVPAAAGHAAEPVKGKPRAARRQGDDGAGAPTDAVAAARARRRSRGTR